MYRKIKLFALALAGTAVFAACDSKKSFETAEEGYQYVYIKNGSGEKLAEGDLLMINMIYKDHKDSTIFNSSDNGEPVVIPFNAEAWAEAGQLYAGFSRLVKGDSILLKINTNDLFTKSFGMAAPPEEFPADSEFTFEIGVVDVMDQEAFEAYQEGKSEVQFDTDVDKIEAYLSENNITAEKTESGLRYIIESEGSGSKPEAGDMVSVHYRGTLLDGTPFDSSYDREDGPFTFPIGQGMVIPGWDEGITLLNKGSKATLFVPSKLAYGERNAGIIKPNSVLIFDVELMDIQKQEKE